MEDANFYSQIRYSVQREWEWFESSILNVTYLYIYQKLASNWMLLVFMCVCALYMGLKILIQIDIIDPNQEKNYVTVQLISTTIIFEMIASIHSSDVFVWWFRKICKLPKVVELAPRTGFTRCFEILTTGNLDLTVHIWTQYAV